MSDSTPTWLPEGYAAPELIATGGQAEVWRARDTRRGIPVAVKRVLRAPSRFYYREVYSQLSLNHPNVVRLLESLDTPEGERLLIMEYCSGGSLRQHLNERRLLILREVLELGCQLASGLITIHEQGLIHGDLKPENVLRWRRHGRIIWKITDFGICRHVNDQEKVRALTPAYAAPEQKTGHPTGKADIHALGKILREAMGSSAEQRGQDASTIRTDLLLLIDRMIANNPAARPTADVLHQELERLRSLQVASRFLERDTLIDLQQMHQIA
jgi:serine/threonine-protein kinase